MITLTQDQSKAVSNFIDFYKNSKESIFLLYGPAGTGKTTVTMEIVDELYKDFPNIRIQVTGPTHEAVKQLRKKLKKNKANIRFSTLHSFWQLRQDVDDNGKLEFVNKEIIQTFDKLKINTDLLIIDEISMVSKKYIEILETHFKVKTLVVGDDRQLPPIGEKLSKAFSLPCPDYELTEIKRQEGSDNPIIELSNNLELLKTKKDKINGIHGYFFRDEKFLIENYIKLDWPIIICWTNEKVAYYNNLVRKLLGLDNYRFNNGERLLLRNQYQIDRDTSVQNGQVLIVKKHRGNELKTFYVTINGLGDFKITFKFINLLCEYNNSETNTYDTFTLPILHDESKIEYDEFLEAFTNYAKKQKKKEIWRQVKEFESINNIVNYYYAITVHRDQGATHKNVFMDFEDMYKNRDIYERRKLLYTAVTRASSLLIII